jgi:hypothetical protein
VVTLIATALLPEAGRAEIARELEGGPEPAAARRFERGEAPVRTATTT